MGGWESRLFYPSVCGVGVEGDSESIECCGPHESSAFEVMASESSRDRELAKCCSLGHLSRTILENVLQRSL